MRVLLIDDEAPVLRALGRLLGKRYEVVTAGDGAEAIAMLTHDSAFDVILSDLEMPTDARVVHRWLCDHHPRLAAAMLVMTGGARTPETRAWLDAFPSARILRKPSSSDEIHAAIREVAGSISRIATESERRRRAAARC